MFPRNKPGKKRLSKRFQKQLQIERMEERIAYVVGAFAVPAPVAPGTGFDGVVQLVGATGAGCTGTLLPSGRHVLTAAHCITNNAGVIDQTSTTVTFQMPGNTISMVVPQANYYLHHPWTGNTSNPNDIAILLLPSLAPSGPAGLGAERFDIYRDTNEVGQNFTFVGYGRTGTGTTGDTQAGGTKRLGQNRFEALSQVVGGPANTGLAFDFDNGNATNDALGARHSLSNLGLGAVEANTAPGDSGGPSFIGNRIAAVTSYGYGYTGNPDMLPGTNSSFGEISVNTRVSSYAWWIDYITSGRHDLTIDMNTQVVGRDGAADTIELRRSGTFLDVIINGQLYHRDIWNDVGQLSFLGSGAADTLIVPADLGGYYSVFIDGRGGANQLAIRSRDNSRTYTVTDTYVDITGSPKTGLNYRNMPEIVVGAGASDTVNVWSTAVGTNVRIVEAGTVVVGPHGDLSRVRGNVNITNPPSYTALTINDSAETQAASSVFLGGGSVSGIAPATISWTANDLRSLTIRGSQLGSNFTILDTPQSGIAGGLTTNLVGGNGVDQVSVLGTSGGLSYEGTGGQDIVSVANATFGLQAIRGGIAMQNYAGQTTLNINDSLNASGRIAAATYPGNGWSTINALAPASISHRLSQTANVNITLGSGDDIFTFDNTDTAGLNLTTLNTGPGNNTVHVRAVTGPLTINAGGDNDTLSLLGVPPMTDHSRLITFNAGNGNDSVRWNDQAQNSSQTYELFNTTLRRGVLDIQLGSVESVEVKAGSNHDDFIVFSQAPGQVVTFFGGNGNDRFLTGALTAGGVRGPVQFHGEAGSDNRIMINDLLDTTGDVVHIDQNSVGATPGDSLFGEGGSLNFSNVQRIDLTCGSGNDTVIVQPNATAAINIDLGPQNGFRENGDELRLALALAQNYLITPGAAGEGTVTSDNFQPIQYTSVETLNFDDAAPQVVVAEYVESPVPTVRFVFNEDVGATIANTSLILTNTTTNQDISADEISLVYDSQNYVAEFTFPVLANGVLPAGDYSATLAAHVSDSYGNALADYPPLLFRPTGVWGTFVVNAVGDAGDGICDATECTLREAIDAANTRPNSDAANPDRIVFELPGAGPFSIQPLTALPAIVDPVVLDGTTQSGFTGAPIVELDGSLTTDSYGLTITAGNSTVRGFAINRFASSLNPTAGIGLFQNGGNRIQGNYIGTTTAGDGVFSSEFQMTYGVVIFGSDNNWIGTDSDGINDAFEGNLISGQVSSGVLLQDNAMGNTIAGNALGTSADGSAALGNGRFGIFFLGAGGNNRIGTDSDGIMDDLERNVISGNLEGGIVLDSSENIVAGNLIGTDATGTLPLPNGHGIWIDQGSNNLIGGATSSSANVIAFNTLHGVYVTHGTGNRTQGNAIFENTGLGINLHDDNDPLNGVTPNDAGDGDLGSNMLQNYAELMSAVASGDSVQVLGTLDSTPNSTLVIEFFRNTTCHASGFGQGEYSLGSLQVDTDSNGHADVQWSAANLAMAGQFISSTVTDASGNTSEFSACIPVVDDNVSRWISAEDGVWTDPANWENGDVPGAGDHVIIDVPDADVSITIPAGSYELSSLISHENLILESADLTLQNTSEISHVELDAPSHLRLADGILYVSGGSSAGEFQLMNSSVLQLQGGFRFQDGSQISDIGLLQFTGTEAVKVEGSVSIAELEVGAAAQLDLQGTLATERGMRVLFGGTLVGNGTIQGNLTNAGQVSPGNSLGLLRIEGDYAQTADASVTLEVAGTEAAEFDRIQVTGNADLAGTLELVFVDGYQPTLGDAISPFTYGSVQGLFAAVPGSLVAQYSANEIRVFPTASISLDFVTDGVLDSADLDALFAEIVAGTQNAQFDTNGDGNIDLADRNGWLAGAGAVNLPSGNPYRLGDANLDGVVDGSDFGIWNSHKFTSTSRWSEGDFNADGVADGSDFGIWNANKFTASDSIASRRRMQEKTIDLVFAEDSRT